jgi:hypothetical protein
MAVGVIAAAILSSIGTMLVRDFLGESPVSRGKTALLNQAWPNELLPAQSAVWLYLNEKISKDEFDHAMRSLGYTPEKADWIARSMQTRLDPSLIVAHGRRIGLNDPEIIQRLIAHGYDPDEAEKYLITTMYYPGPSDLIHWQAKEVFEEDSIRRYGLADEFDRLDLSMFAKAGVSRDQARNYWIAHWEHPGWATVQTMMWRDLISEEDAWEWFRTVEIPPYWRQKLIDVSHKPYTRVDVRRMHKLKVLDDTQLKRAYMDLGYDDEKASKMVEWTIKYNQVGGEDPDRDLTRSQIEQAYNLGVVSRDEAGESFTTMGYDETETAFMLELLDERSRMTDAQDWLVLLKNQRASGLISGDQLRSRLTTLGFTQTAISHYAELFAAYEEEPSKIPSKSDVKAFVQHELITDTQARAFLRDLAYSEEVIDLFLLDWTGGAERYAEWVQKMMEVWEQQSGG